MNTLLAYVFCVNTLRTVSSKRQYGFNRGGINSVITVLQSGVALWDSMYPANHSEGLMGNKDTLVTLAKRTESRYKSFTHSWK